MGCSCAGRPGRCRAAREAGYSAAEREHKSPLALLTIRCQSRFTVSNSVSVMQKDNSKHSVFSHN